VVVLSYLLHYCYVDTGVTTSLSRQATNQIHIKRKRPYTAAATRKAGTQATSQVRCAKQIETGRACSRGKGKQNKSRQLSHGVYTSFSMKKQRVITKGSSKCSGSPLGKGGYTVGGHRPASLLDCKSSRRMGNHEKGKAAMETLCESGRTIIVPILKWPYLAGAGTPRQSNSSKTESGVSSGKGLLQS
jgi:hypothetical protein